MARIVLIFALVASVLATTWLIVGSFASYVPMTSTQMQNLYIDHILRYGGLSLLSQVIALPAAFYAGRYKASKPLHTTEPPL